MIDVAPALHQLGDQSFALSPGRVQCMLEIGQLSRQLGDPPLELAALGFGLVAEGGQLSLQAIPLAPDVQQGVLTFLD